VVGDGGIEHDRQRREGHGRADPGGDGAACQCEHQYPGAVKDRSTEYHGLALEALPDQGQQQGGAAAGNSANPHTQPA
jgi:hypothetical protein